MTERDKIYEIIKLYCPEVSEPKKLCSTIQDYAEDYHKEKVKDKVVWDKANNCVHRKGWFKDNEGNFYIDLNPFGLDMGGKITIRCIGDNHHQYELRNLTQNKQEQ